jgi:hypothetical protein
MLIFLTILKVIVVLTGFGFSAAYFFPGLKKRDKMKLKRALLFFSGTSVLILLITAAEFVFIYYRKP